MKSVRAARCLLATAVLCLSCPLLAAIQLVPVVSSGLSSPVFVGNAGDGTNRLFILEQPGVIRVLQPGSSTPTAFLDLHTKVVAGGEQGLLGLAFHPQYASNGRFFVYYTRAGDGTIVIAEYRVSGNPNVADPAETVLLTIPHPTNTNHNGGMLAFGPDGYLYVGVGDGGGGNDVPNNAQNIGLLLGKILRIDVSVPLTYSSPSTNPFFGTTPGRDEIFAYGMRNPWRFSFDRVTGAQWVGDVGQSAHEEVDTPIVTGGNYGWRVFEGFSCTNNDPALCASPQNYVFPAFDYPHSGGRCSITGGYVYRGAQGAVPSGTYIYGDYCSGEIMAWNGTAQSVLLDTAQNISSFGEDEHGELYVVNLGGTVSKIAPTTPCTFGIAPSSQNFAAGGGSGSVTVTTGASCAWTAVSNVPWVHITSGAGGGGNGNVDYSVDANASPLPRSGTMTIAGQTFTVNQQITPAPGSYQGLWWKSDEPYWGVNFAHQGHQVFATWYTYDTAGNAYWLSMLAPRTSATSNAYSGDIYVDVGPPFNNFVGIGSPGKVGTGTITFTDANNATFAYKVSAGGASNIDQSKPITRYSLGGAQPTCTYSASANLAGATNYQDLWWVPTESGWGVNFAHQGNQLFATWYTYDAKVAGNNAPLWLSALMQKGAGNIFTGPLTRTSGPRFDNYKASDVVQPIPTVGTATVTFTDGNHASFHYVTNGIGGLPVADQTKSITRFLFGPNGATICQ